MKAESWKRESKNKEDVMNEQERLKEILENYGKIAIAYSGGCDSNFLLHYAIQCLGKDNVLAVLCEGAMMSREDLQEAKNYLKDLPHVIVPLNVFDIKEFTTNDKRRCYFCKKNVMSHVLEEAHSHGFDFVCDGMNLDDVGVYRPGQEATKELGILSPLYEAGFTKKMIRACSKEMHIPTYNKPANACLASRFDYDTLLTPEKLNRVDQAEAYLHQKGIRHCRVRCHDDLARIEVESKERVQVLEDQELIPYFKTLGFRFVTLDMEGITSGGYDR